jgi:hypothetical protein
MLGERRLSVMNSPGVKKEVTGETTVRLLPERDEPEYLFRLFPLAKIGV